MTKPTEVSIILAGAEGLSVNAAQQAMETRDLLIANARRGNSITTAQSAERATGILSDIKAFKTYIETGRKAAKEPILAKGRAIDALAETLTADLIAEERRISGLLGAYNAEQKRLAEQAAREAAEKERAIREAADRAAAEAKAKLDAERAAADLKAQEAALMATSQAEAERALAEAEKEKQRLREQAIREQEARDEAERKAVLATKAQLAKAAPVVAAGTATRGEIVFEITDIVALYEAAPYLVKMEPNVAALKAALKQLPAGKHLPGVTHRIEMRASVR